MLTGDPERALFRQAFGFFVYTSEPGLYYVDGAQQQCCDVICEDVTVDMNGTLTSTFAACLLDDVLLLFFCTPPAYAWCSAFTSD